MRWAYFSAQTNSAEECARTNGGEAFAHISHCGKWNYCAHTHNGEKGVLAFWKGMAPGRADLSEGVVFGDLTYFAPDPLPSQKELAKASPYPSAVVTTHRGIQLSIPLAVGAPRMVSFTGNELTGFSGDFAEMAFAVNAMIDNIADEDEDIALLDDRLIELVGRSIQENYAVTPELLDDLGWITSIDIIPIYRAIMGADPLPLGAENDTYNSAPTESSENPDLLQTSGN